MQVEGGKCVIYIGDLGIGGTQCTLQHWNWKRHNSLAFHTAIGEQWVGPTLFMLGASFVHCCLMIFLSVCTVCYPLKMNNINGFIW